MLEVGRSLNERPTSLGHFFAIHSEEPMNVDFFRQAQPRRFQHGGPEQRVEIGNVFPDKMMNFGARILPPVIQLFPMLLAPFGGRADIPDRSVKPDVPVIARAIGNFKAEIRCRAGNIPVPQRLDQKMPFQVVGDLVLQMPPRLRPLGQPVMQAFDLNKQMLGGPQFRSRTGKCTDGINQVCRTISRTTLLAVVTVLIGGVTVGFRTGPLDEAIRQECFFDRVKELRHILFHDQSGGAEGAPDLVT